MMSRKFASSLTGLQMLKSVCILSLVLWNCPAVLSSQALVIIDVQDCFIGNGTLPIKHAENVIPVINKIRQDYEKHFSLVALVSDWHCDNHVSFASSHANQTLFDTIDLTYLSTGELCKSEITRCSYAVDCTTRTEDTVVLPQKLWTNHCIKNTDDAGFHKDLIQKKTDVVIRKGQLCQVDSYSAFFDNGGFTQTDLHEKLSERGIQTVFLVGLFLDFCVVDSARDALKLGYETYVVLDASWPIADSTAQAAIKEMTELGVKLITSVNLDNILTSAAPGKDKDHALIRETLKSNLASYGSVILCHRAVDKFFI